MDLNSRYLGSVRNIVLFNKAIEEIWIELQGVVCVVNDGRNVQVCSVVERFYEAAAAVLIPSALIWVSRYPDAEVQLRSSRCEPAWGDGISYYVMILLLLLGTTEQRSTAQSGSRNAPASHEGDGGEGSGMESLRTLLLTNKSFSGTIVLNTTKSLSRRNVCYEPMCSASISQQNRI